jgi:A nuclease family of the HNH/ENDO VII superfamily with conserved AHH
VKKVSPSKQDAERARLVKESFPDQVVYGTPDMSIVYSTKKRRRGVSRAKTVSENLVTGQIDFDINNAKNGEWLPSNNAVVDWAAMAAELEAQDFTGKGPKRPFQLLYVHHAMRVTKRQFHDAHELYSDAVKDKLKELDLKLNELATACLTHDDTKSTAPDGPFPAPQRLSAALYKMADVIRNEHLILKSSPPVAPWTTSAHCTAAGALL